MAAVLTVILPHPCANRANTHPDNSLHLPQTLSAVLFQEQKLKETRLLRSQCAACLALGRRFWPAQGHLGPPNEGLMKLMKTLVLKTTSLGTACIQKAKISSPERYRLAMGGAVGLPWSQARRGEVRGTCCSARHPRCGTMQAIFGWLVLRCLAAMGRLCTGFSLCPCAETGSEAQAGCVTSSAFLSLPQGRV